MLYSLQTFSGQFLQNVGPELPPKILRKVELPIIPANITKSKVFLEAVLWNDSRKLYPGVIPQFLVHKAADITVDA